MKYLLRLLKVAISRGRVTARYPKEAATVPEGLRGRPVIDFDVCIGCGACVKACPSNALTMEEHENIRAIKLFYGLCLMCGTCDEVCPVDAIRVQEEFELASLTNKDLEEILEFVLAQCRSCGKYYTTKRAINDVLTAYSESVSGFDEEFKEMIYLCPDCRRRELTERFAEASKGETV